MATTTRPDLDERPNGKVIPTIDPRSGAQTGTVPEMGPDEVQAAVARARDAFEEWRILPFAARHEHILGLRDVLLDRLDQVLDVICSETGKLDHEAVLNELMTTCELVSFYGREGEKALRHQRLSAGSMLHKRVERRYEPLGVVGVISPWNYPFVLAAAPVITAALAGNAVVLKPSEVTPRIGLLLGELFAASDCPANLVQVVTGGGSTGEALVRAGVQKVAFTGSVATGKRVMAAAADSLTPVLLELGGKDPMIVCTDADLDRAAGGAVWGAFQNSGQTCVSVERVYVTEPVYDDFVAKVVERARRVRQGSGPDQDIGSMSFAPQIDTVTRHVEDAKAKGARVLVGGQRLERDGLWYEPTVLADVDHTMDVMRDETFGPVLPIMEVADEDEAIRLANDSRFGLNGSVWTRDPDQARRLADEMESGQVCINDCVVSYAMASAPFGGRKDSGIGRIHGTEGLREFSAVKAVLTDRAGLEREAWWFPTPRHLGGITARVLRFRYRRGLAAKLRSLIPARRSRSSQ